MDLTRVTPSITPRRIVLAVILVVGLIMFYWLATHAFLEVTISDTSNGDISYQLLDQKSGITQTTRSSASTTRKLLRKGSYEVLVTQGDSSYFAVVQTKGFLQTTTTKGVLSAERARRFVGNNPATCMNYSSAVLLSYTCNGTVGTATIHKPATANLPTVAERINTNGYSGYIESVFTTKEGALALVKSAGDNDVDVSSSHHLYALDDSYTLTSSTDLVGLQTSETYAATPYKDGFVVYNNDFSQVVYFSSSKASLQTISVEKPKNTALFPAALRVNGDNLVALYTHGTEAGDKNPGTEVVVTDGKVTHHYSLDKNYNNAVLCGGDMLCVAGNQKMDVYSISGKRAAFLYSLTSVTAIEGSGNKLTVARTKDVLNFDVESRSGAIDLAFGDYSFNGVVRAGSNYVLSLSQPNQQKVALYIDRSAANTDSIDQKILELEKSLGVTAVSVYGNFIYISPNLGSLAYDPATKSYGYNPAMLQTAKNNISQALAKAGIDQKTYTIVINQ